MTEPRPTYAVDRSEAEIQREVVKRLRAAGWFVRVFAQSRRTQKQLAGWPDVVAFRRDVLLLLECKRPTKKLEPEQVKFRIAVNPHLGRHLIYRVVRYPEDVAEWTEEAE